MRSSSYAPADRALPPNATALPADPFAAMLACPPEKPTDDPVTADVSSHLLVEEMLVTALVLAGFVGTRTLFARVKQRWSRMTVVVVGAGPIGLTAVLIAARSGRVSRLVVFEELCRSALVNRLNQIAFQRASIAFLRRLGIDFDNMEGCWENDCFFTRVGIFLEYLLSIIYKLDIPIDIKLNTKFTRNYVKEIESIHGRVMLLACDGCQGQAGRFMGLSDECIQHSCRAYCAVAAIDRADQHQVPVPEKRVHNLQFDLSAYGTDTVEENCTAGFSLKIFGSTRNRYMTLVIPKCDLKVVKTLRVILDRSVMRNIFQKCFNTFKNGLETKIGESEALENMKFNPRLFEIKLFQRRESATYFSDFDIAILAEGDAARCYNFTTGMDVNFGIKGLMSLPAFIEMISWANTEYAIISALVYKTQHADKVCKEFLKNGLKEYFFT